ncbi:ribonuclease P protein subunit p38-like [Amphiura filiformis]|uniref:ribonuclease P protein subunit p38-like n=1 Tax=Amphiura filiformis TaxID=82378 RepID=UPI003B20D2E8
MSAPTVKKQAKTVRGKKKDQVTVKNVLFSPYVPEWPGVAVGETPKILEQISRTFEPYRILPNMKKMKQGKTWAEKKWTTESLVRVEEAKKRKVELRSYVVFGVNGTTKSLEKGQLDLVVVCRSAKPPILTGHLLTLAACRGVPALALSGLSETLSKMMRARSIIALGFNKCCKDNASASEFTKLANFIKDRTPAVTLPWLQYKDTNLEELRQKVVEASKGRIQGKPGKGHGAASRTPPESSKSKDSLPSTRTDKLPALQSVDTSGMQSTSLKRTSEEAELDAERKKKVSKVTFLSGKTIPVRSVPQEMKQEWKKTKKNKKKRKK